MKMVSPMDSLGATADCGGPFYRRGPAFPASASAANASAALRRQAGQRQSSAGDVGIGRAYDSAAHQQSPLSPHSNSVLQRAQASFRDGEGICGCMAQVFGRAVYDCHIPESNQP